MIWQSILRHAGPRNRRNIQVLGQLFREVVQMINMIFCKHGTVSYALPFLSLSPHPADCSHPSPRLSWLKAVFSLHCWDLAHQGEDVPRPQTPPDWRKNAIKVSVCGDKWGEIFETGVDTTPVWFFCFVYMFCVFLKALAWCLVVFWSTMVIALILFNV